MDGDLNLPITGLNKFGPVFYRGCHISRVDIVKWFMSPLLLDVINFELHVGRYAVNDSVISLSTADDSSTPTLAVELDLNQCL